ncbi:EmrB/QacA subfamily drug resistance transporter [Nocardiopsis sp. Huas11]|uniref:MFS transporter n=1 Tax=Nocardiopsis sp. Huas11 TaxID=2183912 RepID=UPI000EB15534|nr:MFS transporter [Nocardiopsis sp. Huas11]RKS10050.1 EmrB/QacA subfamily drug resistance transporter [Nocardiopsis sp. Huas11]
MTATRASSARSTSGLTLALLALGHLVISLDFTIVFVALPEIAAEVGFTAHSLQWVVTAYVVFYGGFLLLGGRMSDLLGQRRMFVTGMVLYGLSSLVGGFATTPEVLIGARVVQGLGGALLFPAVLSLVNSGFPEGRERNRALTVWAAAGAGGLSLGALLGGALTGAFGWAAVFFVNVPLAVVGVAAAFVLLDKDERRERAGGFDLAGALVGTSGTTLLVFAVAQGPELGWSSTPVVFSGLLAVVLLAGFLVVETRSRTPLMPLRLFRNRHLSAAMAVILVFGFSVQNAPYFLTLYFQDVLGFSAVETGLAFLAPTLSITLGNIVSDRLVGGWGTRTTLLVGIVLNAAGAGLLALGLTVDGSLWTVLPGTVVLGVGMGVTYTSMWIAASTGVDDREQGAASGMASTALQLGAAAGLAVLVGVYATGLDGLAGEPLRVASAEGMRVALCATAAFALAGLAAAFALPRRADRAA